MHNYNKLILLLRPNFPQNHFPLHMQNKTNKQMCFQNSETHKKWSLKGQTSYVPYFIIYVDEKTTKQVKKQLCVHINCCLLYTSDAADE